MEYKSKKIFEISVKSKVSVMRTENLNFLLNYLRKHKFLKTILEIGTGCGYSTYQLSKLKNIKKIISIEKNKIRFKNAQFFLKKNKKIFLVNADVNNFKCSEKYDVIILDGPKKHNDLLIDKFLPWINKNGICVIDNLYLNDIRNKYLIEKNKRYKGLIKSSDELQLKLINMNQKNYNVIIDKSGDGLAIIEICN